MHAAVFHDPGVTGKFLCLVIAPALGGLAVKKRFPIVGFFRRGTGGQEKGGNQGDEEAADEIQFIHVRW